MADVLAENMAHSKREQLVVNVHQDSVIELAVDQLDAGEEINLGDVNYPLKEIEGVLVTRPDVTKVALNIDIHDGWPRGSKEVLCFGVERGADNNRLKRVEPQTCEEELKQQCSTSVKWTDGAWGMRRAWSANGSP